MKAYTSVQLLGAMAQPSKPSETIPLPELPVTEPSKEGIAHPGSCYRLHFYPDPKTGEQVRGYRRLSYSIVYYSPRGRSVHLYSPPTDRPLAEYDQQFLNSTPGDVVLVDRRARRATSLADRRKMRARKKEQARSTVATA